MSEVTFENSEMSIRNIVFAYINFSNLQGAYLFTIKYCFLLYITTKNDSAKLRILICEFLIYTDTFFDDIYPTVAFHLRSALLLHNDNIYVMHWILDTFYGNPNSPFENKELIDFARSVILVYPDDSRAIEVINHIG